MTCYYPISFNARVAMALISNEDVGVQLSAENYWGCKIQFHTFVDGSDGSSPFIQSTISGIWGLVVGY